MTISYNEYPLDDTECYFKDEDEKAAYYRGTVSKTNTGLTCQKWTEQAPNSHSVTPSA